MCRRISLRHLHYAFQSAGFEQDTYILMVIHNVQSFQTAAMRFFLGVGTSCPNTGLFGEMGWVSLQAELSSSGIGFALYIHINYIM